MNSKIYAQNSLTSAFYLFSSVHDSLFYFQNVEIYDSKINAIYATDSKLFLFQTIIFNAYEAISLKKNMECSAKSLFITNSFNRAINLEENSKFYCDKCEFTLNKNFIIEVSKNSNFVLENCKIFENKLKLGYLIYISSGTDNECKLINCTIYSNSLYSGSLIYVDSSLLYLKDCIIENNEGLSTNIKSIYLFNSSLHLHDSKLQFNSLVENGAFIYAIDNSFVFAENSVFEKSLSKKGNFFGTKSTIALLNCTFFGNSGGDIYTFESIINISNSNFENSILSSINSGAIELKSNNITRIEESLFRNISSMLEFIGQSYIYDDFGIQLELFDCTFIGSSNSISALVVKESDFVSIDNSNFFEFNTVNISVLTLVSNENGRTLNIKNSKISHNMSNKFGGGVYSESYNLIIDNTIISFNTALDSGGGIYFISPNCDDCGLYLLGKTQIFNNTCNFDGGGVKWKDYKPFIEDSVLVFNNSAAYGPDFASTPVTFGILQNDIISDSIFINLSNVPPGKKFTGVVQVVIFDIYKQVIKTENSLTATLFGNDTDYLLFSLSGKTTYNSKNGVLNITEFILSGNPDSKAIIKLKSDDFKKYITRNDKVEYSDSVFINVELRNCTRGEQIQKNACIDCERGKYALTASENCLNCPAGATCSGGSAIIVNDGHWRSSLESDVIYICDVLEACIKGTEINELGNCSTGYFGVLCKSCKIGFSKTANSVCTKCPSETNNVIIMFFLCISLALLCFTLVKTTLTSAFSPKSLHSIYIKIFTNYLQLVYIVTQLDLE